MRVQFYDWESQIQDNQETTEKFVTFDDFFRHYCRVMGWRFKAVIFDNMTEPFPQKNSKFDFHVDEKKFSCSVVV